MPVKRGNFILGSVGELVGGCFIRVYANVISSDVGTASTGWNI
jgi:hypothetical protein